MRTPVTFIATSILLTVGPAAPTVGVGFADAAMIQPQATTEVGDPYPLATCPVSGKRLGSEGEIVYRRLDGRDLRLGSRSAVKPFDRSLNRYIREIDAELVRLQLPHYPLDTCIVTGEKLGDRTVNHIYRNRLVRLSGKSAVRKFEREAAAYVALLDSAVVSARVSSYPLKTCIVSGNDLSEIQPVEFVIGNRLFRVCCVGCATTIRTDPPTYLAKLDQAYEQQSGQASAH